MYKILLAIDGSTNSLKAAEEVSRMAGPLQAEVTIISVIKDIPVARMPDEIHKTIESNTEKMLEEARDFLKERGVESKVLTYHGDPGNIICEVAEKDGYNLIAMGSSGLGSIGELFLGSVSNKVVHHAKTSVIIVK